MSETLLPCPFCGGECELTDNDSARDMMYMISCSSGCIHSCYYDTKKAAIKAWNKRYEEDLIIQFLKEAEKAGITHLMKSEFPPEGDF